MRDRAHIVDGGTVHSQRVVVRVVDDKVASARNRVGEKFGATAGGQQGEVVIEGDGAVGGDIGIEREGERSAAAGLHRNGIGVSDIALEIERGGGAAARVAQENSAAAEAAPGGICDKR